MSKFDQPTSEQQFLHEGFATYNDVARAVHRFQTLVADTVKGVLESVRDRRSLAGTKLADVWTEVVGRIWPDFPNDSFDYAKSSIRATVWLDEPLQYTLYLGIMFSEASDQQPSSEILCAVEVRQQYRRDELLEVLRGHMDHFAEPWGGYAVGLRRALNSPETLRDELTALLGDFLTCFDRTYAKAL